MPTVIGCQALVPWSCKGRLDKYSSGRERSSERGRASGMGVGLCAFVIQVPFR